jgi:hypothetical protein
MRGAIQECRPTQDLGCTGGAREIGDAENISKSYVSRILRLALLGPGIVEEILDGHAGHPLMLGQLERSLPASWVEQRVCISRAQPKCDRIQTSVFTPGQLIVIRRPRSRPAGTAYLCT